MSDNFFIWSLIFIGITLLLGALVIPILIIFLYGYYAKGWKEKLEKAKR